MVCEFYPLMCLGHLQKRGGLSDGDPFWYIQAAAFWWSPGSAALIFWSWSWLCEEVSTSAVHILFLSWQEAAQVPQLCQVMSCRKVLCLCGKTFPRRLWRLDTHLKGLTRVRDPAFSGINRIPNKKLDTILQFGSCYKPILRIHF